MEAAVRSARMGNNAQRMSPGPMPVAQPRSTIGSALASGVHGARSSSTPPSGVRNAPEPTHAGSGAYVPPRPDFDSEPQLTRVFAPDESLLAMAREKTTPQRRSRSRLRAALMGFAVGAVTGGLAVWGVTSNVYEDVYRARMWIASELRAMRSPAPPVDAIAPAPAPAPAAAETPLPDPAPTGR